MNFFDAQERSRRRTRYLIAVLLGATLVVALSVTVVIGAAYYLSTRTQHGMPVAQWAANNDTVERDSEEANPYHIELIDQSGHRYKLDESFDYHILVHAMLLF